MPIYLKDLIHIPEQMNRADFVLNLVDGVQHPKETVVVLPEFVRQCLTNRKMS